MGQFGNKFRVFATTITVRFRGTGYVSTLVSGSSAFCRGELFRASADGVWLLYCSVCGRHGVSHPWARPWPLQTHGERDARAPSRPDGHSAAARQSAGDHTAECSTSSIGALALGLMNITFAIRLNVRKWCRRQSVSVRFREDRTFPPVAEIGDS